MGMSELDKKLNDLELQKHENKSENKDISDSNKAEEIKKEKETKKDDKSEKKEEQKKEKEVESPFLKTTLKIIEEKPKMEEEKLEEFFKGYSILYRFMPEQDELKERGVGDLIIELFPENNLYRLRMIRKQIESYACNHYIEPTAHFSKHEITKNAFVWTTTTDVCDLVETKIDGPIEV